MHNMKINKKILISLLPTILLVGCLASCNPTPTPDPGPEPTPTYPIDFDFNPTSDENITVEKGETRQVQIKFKQTSYINNVKSIEWTIDTESAKYITKGTEAKDHMYCSFTAKEITPELSPAFLTVTVVNKDDSITKKKTCSISVDPKTYPIDFDFIPTTDSSISIDKNETRQVQIEFKKPDYSSNYKSITWSIETGSGTYIEKVSEASDHMSFQFKAKEITTDKPAQLKVTIESKDDITSKSQTCSIYVEDPVNKTLVHDGSWYSYKKKGTIAAGTNFKFTATRDNNHKITYFGMSEYNATQPPYFDVGYNNVNKTVNVTDVSLYNGSTTRKLVYGESSSSELYPYSSTYSGEILVTKSSLFEVGYKIIIECTITKELTNGLWAYVGSY